MTFLSLLPRQLRRRDICLALVLEDVFLLLKSPCGVPAFKFGNSFELIEPFIIVSISTGSRRGGGGAIAGAWLVVVDLSYNYCVVGTK